MARDWKKKYEASAAAAQHAVDFTQAAVAGHTFVAFASAPATIHVPDSWTEVADPLGQGELSAAIFVASGGETQLVWDRDPAASTAPRSLAGWVESRDDLGTLQSTPQAYTDALTGSGPLETAPLTVTEDGSRIYVAVSCNNASVSSAVWTPTFGGAPLTLEDTATTGALGAEPSFLSVASGVVDAGSYNITISGLPAGISVQIVSFVMSPGSGTTPPPAPPAETAVEAENRLPGVSKNTWDITGAGDANIQGYATAMSVPRGGVLSVKVNSPLSAWTGKVYRVGYYDGLGAREVDTITGVQTAQPNGTVDSTTGMVSCSNWTVNGNWSVPSDAVAGTYFIKIYRNDSPSAASHIGPFVVTDPSRKAKIVVKLSDSTWQAYNHAGSNPADIFNGKSLYGQGSSSGFTFDRSTRARAVSYDRPFVTRQFLPQTFFWNAEYPLIRWLERLGYDVDYVSSVQVDADPTLLQGREVVISSGHDEYWSEGMWNSFTSARDHATENSNLLFMSGNEAFWHIRFADGRRSFSCWKDTHDGALNSTGLYSGTWQDTRGFNTERRPPALLNGQRFRLNGISAYAMGIPASMASVPMWRNTEVASLTTGQTWTSPVGIVGFEADEPADTNNAEKPAGLLRLSQISHSVSNMLADNDGNQYDLSGTYTHAITAYRAGTGAAVFAFGTVQYSWGLDDNHDRASGSMTSVVLQQGLTNLLADLGAVPPAYPLPSELTMPTPVAISSYGFPVTPPSAPTNLTGNPAQTSVALEWTASAGATGYRIYRNAVLIAEVGSQISYVSSGLNAGTSYQFHVTAVNAGGESVASNVVTVVTLSPTPTTPLPSNESWSTAKLLRKEFMDFKLAVESGTVTGGMSPTLFNSKGDLLGASANDTPVIVPVGQNGQVLSADSTAPAGVKWVDPPEGGGGTPGEPVIAPGVVSQYWRGDKTWQLLDKNAVGLGAVNNTADSQKPVSAAQDAADKLRPYLRLWNPNTNSYDTVVAGTIYLGGPSDPTTNPGDIWIESA